MALPLQLNTMENSFVAMHHILNQNRHTSRTPDVTSTTAAQSQPDADGPKGRIADRRDYTMGDCENFQCMCLINECIIFGND
ncbi:hypothetical protein DPMN_179246 [Dreissena polymorpha]|uniref:Uncharacterized protein n=1 Tax=Dreissena polymorpha TaxID=45954 RepID=A0A9D4INC0_DREPO|nr:hypothetical protein DPMN_179246 [Dreissena polymorpha]